MRLIICLAALVVSMATAGTPVRRCSHFQRLSNHSDVTTQAGLLWETVSTSLSACASLCGLRNSCQAFLHQPASGRCLALTQTPTSNETSPAPGFELRRRVGACPTERGYVWNETVAMCLQLRLDETRYSGASKRCRKDGGDLVIIRTAEENDFFLQYLQLHQADNVMTGGIRVTTNVYQWVDGSPVTQFFYGPGSITFKQLILIRNGVWTTGPSNWKRKFVCQIPAPSTKCP